MNRQQKQTAGGIAAVLALILGALVVGSQPPAPPPAATSTTSSISTSSTSTTSAVPTTTPATSVRTWFRASTTWNRTVAELGAAPAALQEYAQRLWTYGGGPAPAGTINLAGADYSVPVYRASDATTIARLYQTTASQALYATQIPIGDVVPWNPTWKAGSGNDGILIVIDEATGRVWEIGGIGQPAYNCVELFGLGPNSRAGFDPTNPNHLCTMGGVRWDGLYTADEHAKVDGRGMGQPKAALLTRADEVASGRIGHALQMTIVSTMFGQPACTPAGTSSAPGFGTTCGGYVAPATKLERTNPDVGSGCAKQVVTPAERAKTVPEGMRFALSITDAEIDRWLDSRKYTGALRTTARTFAVALRDYGWIIAETGCWGMLIELESVLGPAGPTWARLGIVDRGKAFPHGDLLNGLFTPDRIYVVAAPT